MYAVLLPSFGYSILRVFLSTLLSLFLSLTLCTPFPLLPVCDGAHTRIRRAHTHIPFSLSSLIHSCSLSPSTAVCRSPSPIPLSLYSLSSVPARGCWLQTGSWKFAIQDIDQLTRPTHPPPIPPPPSPPPSHIRSLPPSRRASLSLSLAFLSPTALLLTIAKQSVCQTLLLIVHLIRSFLLWYSARILYKKSR